MNEKQYFYLEPYTYIKRGNNSVLLINLLDDKALHYKDEQSLLIADGLLASEYRTMELHDDFENAPLVTDVRENFMGDIVFGDSQPIQFHTELDKFEGKSAYKKASEYTQYDLTSYLQKCIVVANPSHPDFKRYREYFTGIAIDEDKPFMVSDKSMGQSEFADSIQRLSNLNPKMTIEAVGIDINELRSFCSSPVIPNVRFIFDAVRLCGDKELRDFILDNNIRYGLLSSVALIKTQPSIHKAAETICIGISEEDSMEELPEVMSGLPAKISIKPILNNSNTNFIKELFTLSEEDLLSAADKYRTIKMNNLVNSNLWGTFFLYPGGKICFSLVGNKESAINIETFYKDFKKLLSNGKFEWTKIRDYDNCQACSFQWLCPAPSYIEDYLREKDLIGCLLSDNVSNEKGGEYELQ